MAHNEACQLFIEEQIKEGLAEGKKPSTIGKELSAWTKRLWEANIPSKTLAKRAERARKATNVASNNVHYLDELEDEETVIDDKKSPDKRPVETPPKGAVFNETNDNIDWARWTWNPVTGCLHDCKYCYARDIANRFYKQKFKPTFHPHRLVAPKNTPMGERTSERDRNVFVCSMADLFGKWVPPEWIDKILASVRDNPQWDFIFLTKNPTRMVGIDWPDNVKVGATVDVQSRVEPTEKAFKAIDAPVKFLSCEPLLEPLHFNDLMMFHCVIIGAQSKSTQCPAKQPERSWVTDIIFQSENSGVDRIFLKPNLTVYRQVP